MKLAVVVLLALSACGKQRASPPKAQAPVATVDAAVPPVPSYEVARLDHHYVSVATSATHVVWSNGVTVWRRPHGPTGETEVLGETEARIFELHAGPTTVYGVSTEARTVVFRPGTAPVEIFGIGSAYALDGDDLLVEDRGKVLRYRGDELVETTDGPWTAKRFSLEGFEHQGAAGDARGAIALIGPLLVEIEGGVAVRASAIDVHYESHSTYPMAITDTYVYLAAPLAGAVSSPDSSYVPAVLRALPRRGLHPVIAVDASLGEWKDSFTDGRRVFAIFEAQDEHLTDTVYRIDDTGAHAIRGAWWVSAAVGGDDVAIALPDHGYAHHDLGTGKTVDLGELRAGREEPLVVHRGHVYWDGYQSLKSRPVDRAGDVWEAQLPDHGEIHSQRSTWLAFLGDLAYVVSEERIVAIEPSGASRWLWRYTPPATQPDRNLMSDIVAIDDALFVTDGTDVIRVTRDGESTVLAGPGKADIVRLFGAGGRLFALDNQPDPSQIVEIPLDGSARRAIFLEPNGYLPGRVAITETAIHIYVPGMHGFVVVPLD